MTVTNLIYIVLLVLFFFQNLKLWKLYQAAREAGQKYAQKCAYFECSNAHFQSMSEQAIESLELIAKECEDPKIQAENTLDYMHYRTEKFDEGMKRWASLNPGVSESLNLSMLSGLRSESSSTTNLQ